MQLPIIINAKEPIRYKENSGIKFGIMLKPVLKSGTIEKNENGLTIRTSDDFYIILTGKTDFDGCDNIIVIYERYIRSVLSSKGYKQIKTEPPGDIPFRFLTVLDLHSGGS